MSESHSNPNLDSNRQYLASRSPDQLVELISVADQAGIAPAVVAHIADTIYDALRDDREQHTQFVRLAVIHERAAVRLIGFRSIQAVAGEEEVDLWRVWLDDPEEAIVTEGQVALRDQLSDYPSNNRITVEQFERLARALLASEMRGAPGA